MSTQVSAIQVEEPRIIATEGHVKESLQAVVDWKQYDGERVKGSNSPAIFLVLNGQLRWIPDPDTYGNLFQDWNGVVVSDYLVNSIPMGTQLTHGAVLAKGPTTAPEYLVSNGMKCWIPSPAVFTQFHFNSAKVVVVPQVIIDSMPTGMNIG